MPNIANILKGEISRVARKEIRSEALTLKKSIAAYRAAIAALRRRTHALEQQVRQLGKINPGAGRAAENKVSAATHRFSAKSLAAQRRRLGLSASDCGLLLGASSQSIYNWEQGKARPLTRHLPAIIGLRTLSKKVATAHLESLRKRG